MFHQHKWKIVSMDIRKSPYELALENPRAISMNQRGAFPEGFYRGSVVVEYRCDCGAEKVEVKP